MAEERREVRREVELTVDAVAGGTRLVVVERALLGPTALSATAWAGHLARARSALALVAA